MKKRTKADRRRAALLGIRRQKAAQWKRSEAAKRGWITRKKLYGPSGVRSKRKPFKPRKPKKPLAVPTPRPSNLREYFVVLIFKTRKQNRTVTRRLYEAIVTLHDGANEDEILKAYQEKVQQEHPKLHNAEIERLLFGPNRGRTVNIVPRDTIGSDVPSGSVRVNDARNPAKRKRKARINKRRNKQSSLGSTVKKKKRKGKA